MINVNKSKIKLEGCPSELCGELGIIFNEIYEQLGETELKFMIKTAFEVVKEENKTRKRKEQIICKKELKNKLKQDLPEELANILCSLL